MSAVLHLDGEALEIADAKLSLQVSTQAWSDETQTWLYGHPHLTAHWQLDVLVDDQSGEDGAPSPMLTFYLHKDARLPPLNQWRGLAFEDLENQCCEAWLGNDSPAIRQNRLVFGEWRDQDSLIVEWSGRYDANLNRRDLSFRFAGPVRFLGIQMQVKRDEDAATFLQDVFPMLAGELTATWEEWVHYAPGTLPEDRLHWHPVRWTRA